MKKLKFLMILGVSFLLNPLMAQQGHVTYDITFESDEPEVEAQFAMLSGSKMEWMFKNEWSKNSLSMGALMTTSTISNSNTKESILLLEGMMGKIASRMSEEDMNAINEDQEETSIELFDETKEILGYLTKKAIVTGDDGMETTFWYTEEIANPGNGNKYVSSEVPGFPLKFEVSTPQMSMIFEATEFNKKVKKAKKIFTLDVPEGFDVKSIEELRNMGIQE